MPRPERNVGVSGVIPIEVVFVRLGVIAIKCSSIHGSQNFWFIFAPF